MSWTELMTSTGAGSVLIIVLGVLVILTITKRAD